MKKLLIAVGMCSLFISAIALASPTLNKTHKGKKKDGAKINCTYCHKTNKIPKEAKNYKEFQKNAYCSGGECHGK